MLGSIKSISRSISFAIFAAQCVLLGSVPALAKDIRVWMKDGKGSLHFVTGTAAGKGTKKTGVYFEVDGKRKVVAYGHVQQILNPRSDENSFVADDDFYMSAAKEDGVDPDTFIVQVNDKFYVVRTDGTFASIDTDYSKLQRLEFEESKLSAFDVYLDQFESDGRRYHLIQFQQSPITINAEQVYVSDLVLIRDDNASLHFPMVINASSTGVSNRMKVTDGILEVEDALRDIDLRAFDIEAAVPLYIPRDIAGADGLLGAKDTANKYFPDFMKDTIGQQNSFARSDLNEYTPLIDAYHSRMIGSAVVLGPAGVGKTQYLKSFFALVRAGKIKGIPRTIYVPVITAGALDAGTKWKGTGETRLQALVEYSKTRPTAWLVDEIHSLRGAGTHSEKSADSFQAIKGDLADARFRIFGTDTVEEWETAFAGDTALDQRFAKITLEELNDVQTNGAIEEFVRRSFGFLPNPAVVREIYRLSLEYNAVDSNPRKANRLADKTVARLLRIGRDATSVSVEDVREAATEMYGVDRAHFDDASRALKLKQLRTRLDEFLIGHARAKELATELTIQSYMGVHDKRRPRLRLMLAGGKGLGKTEFGFSYAKSMGYRFHRIEMNRFADNPDGADDLRREIATELAKNAFTVFLLDEIEKSSIPVQNALLGILDDGMFSVRHKAKASDRVGTLVRANARNASFILTTNAGHELSYESSGGTKRLGFGTGTSDTGDVIGGTLAKAQSDGSRAAYQKLVREIVSGGVSEFVLDRMQATVLFKVFTRDEFRDVVQMHLRNFLKEVSESRHQPIVLPFPEDQVVESMVNEFYSPRVSGRDAIKAIQDRARNWVAQALYQDRLGDKDLCESLLLKKG